MKRTQRPFYILTKSYKPEWRSRHIAFCLLAAFLAMLTVSCSSIIAHHSFLVPPIRKTPTDLGLQHEDIVVRCGDKKFLGWLVRANTNPDSVSNAVLIFNGIGAGVSAWVNVQKILFDNHISSLVFNYGDLRDTLSYRDDESSTSFADIQCAIPGFFNELVNKTSKNTKYFLLGHSMGCAVLTQHYSLLDTSLVSGLILCSPFSSLRESAVHHGYLSKAFLFVIPEDVFNNTLYVPMIHKPIVVAHSKADSVNLYTWGADVFKAANEPKTFMEYESFNHNYIYKGSVDFWQRIIRFIKERNEV